MSQFRALIHDRTSSAAWDVLLFVGQHAESGSRDYSRRTAFGPSPARRIRPVDVAGKLAACEASGGSVYVYDASTLDKYGQATPCGRIMAADCQAGWKAEALRRAAMTASQVRA